MKICPSCGAGMFDEARFCTACGKPFDSVSAPAASPAPDAPRAGSASCTASAPYTAPVFSGSFRPAVNRDTAANGALTRVCSSGLVSAIAVMLILAIVFSVAGAALLGTVDVKDIMKSIQDMVIDVADKDFDFIITEDDFNSFYEEEGLDELTDLTDSLTGSSVVGALSGSLFNILAAAALLIIFISARKGNVSSAGFVILKVVCIIDLVAVCICALCVFAGTVIGISALSGLGRESAVVKYLTAPATGLAAFLWILMILPILLYSFLIRTLNSMKRIAKTGEYNGRISAAAAVLLIVMSTSGFVWKILGLTLGISVLPAGVLSSLSEILMVAAEVHAGIFILKTKYIVSENA